MNQLTQLANEIDACRFTLNPAEIMRWGHEDLLDSLKEMLASADFGPGFGIHAKVSFAGMFKNGPVYGRIKHVCPDFVITNANRHPVAFLDYLGAGHDGDHDAIKQAVARKTGLAFVQVPREWSFAGVKAALLAALGAQPTVAAAMPVKDARGLQEVLRQDFARAA